MQQAWDGFVGGNWEREIDVRDFIQRNYTAYDGDASFLAGPTEATAIGNLMLQARTAGLVADRWQMRRLVAETFAVKTFLPKQ